MISFEVTASVKLSRLFTGRQERESLLRKMVIHNLFHTEGYYFDEFIKEKLRFPEAVKQLDKMFRTHDPALLGYIDIKEGEAHFDPGYTLGDFKTYGSRRLSYLVPCIFYDDAFLYDINKGAFRAENGSKESSAEERDF